MRWLAPPVQEMISVQNLVTKQRESLPRSTPSVPVPEAMPLDIAQPTVERRAGGCVKIKYTVGNATFSAIAQVRAVCQRKAGARVLIEPGPGKRWVACIVEAAWPS